MHPNKGKQSMKMLKAIAAVLTITATADYAHALKPAEIKRYDTAAHLLAANVDDGSLGDAIDTDAFYARANGAWTAIATLVSLTGHNGGTFANGTNNMWDLSEN